MSCAHGLSPLARGTQHGRPYEIPVARFIPAGAGNSRARGDSGRACTVYPRWRGELSTAGHMKYLLLGLSPLARGTPIHILINHQNKRFIPAGAGNSQYHYIKECRIPVYPRWRGELGTCLIICVATVGLSPLARGTLPLVSCRPRKNRFIPAGAGNSDVQVCMHTQQTVYPRWRGEL